MTVIDQSRVNDCAPARRRGSGGEVSGLPARLDLCIYAGDGFELQCEFFQADGATPQDMTGAWSAEIRDESTGLLLATFTIDETDEATGVIVLRLDEAQTRALQGMKAVWDVQYIASGAPRTWAAGVISTRQDVTQ